MKEIVLATSNPGKVEEFESLLHPIHCIPQIRLNITPVEETGLTFVENAILKARHATEQSQRPALADDSGLIIHALNGEPGIHSARFSGSHGNDYNNICKVLKLMENVPDEQRSATFYCVIVLLHYPHDPAPIIATGQLNGFITRKISGEDGFGYDPIFYIPNKECTAAQLPLRIKNEISHRAQAFRQLHQLLGLKHL